MNVSMTHARLALGPLLLAAAVALPVAPAAYAAGCSGAAPALLLQGPAYAESGGEPAEIVATYRCTGLPASGAHLYAVGKRGHVDLDAAGRALVQFGGSQDARLYAREGAARSNTLVITVR